MLIQGYDKKINCLSNSEGCYDLKDHVEGAVSTTQQASACISELKFRTLENCRKLFNGTDTDGSISI